jgi:hypothetical protein
VLTLAVLAGPVLAYASFESPRAISMVYGFTAMLMGGLLVHFGQGPVQIEMHFYFFALLAMLAVYANPLVILTATATVGVHHLTLWLAAPSSVFNYGAPLWVVLVHVAFVLLESIATCFIARSFFDNVIGLEKIVQARTTELDARNRAMRLVLDHVQQGFLTIGRDMVMSSERSKILEHWLGPAQSGQTFSDYLEASVPRLGAGFALSWGEVIADIMPLEVTLAQLPSSFSLDERHLRIEYEPIMHGESLSQLLVVISDITAEVERERLELEQRDVVRILGRFASDKSGVLEFFQEASEQVELITEQRGDDKVQQRTLHTLKGNSMIFGVQSIARLCERLETRIEITGLAPSELERFELAMCWSKLCESVELLLGRGRKQRLVELDDAEYEGVLAAVLEGEAREQIAARIRAWRFEPTLRRLVRIGEQARALAERCGKGKLAVHIEDHQLRLDSAAWGPFWSAFVHVVRNAVDHGLQFESERAADAPPSTITLSTRVEHDELLIELVDNGRGVDWRRVAEKARQRGLPHETQAELVEALFADGLSTVEQANEYSGRGVGMSAARAACAERGGVVQVSDAPGGGTRVTCRFPYEGALPASLRASA